MKRFYYIKATFGRVAHLYFGKKLVEGEKMACGARLQPKWKWLTTRPADIPQCKSCVAASENI